MRRISVRQPDRRRGITFTQIAAPWIFIGLMLLLSACIRPNANNGTATPAGVIAMTPPLVNSTPGVTVPNSSNNLIRVEAFVQSYGANTTPGSTRLLGEIPYLQDLIAGITFQNQSNLNCIGVGIGNHDGAQNLTNVFSGGYHCMTSPTEAGVAGQWLVTDSRGTPLVIFAGQIFLSNAQSVVMLNPDGTQNSSTPLANGGFMFVVSSLNFPSEASIRDAGNVEIGRVSIPVSPQG